MRLAVPLMPLCLLLACAGPLAAAPAAPDADPAQGTDAAAQADRPDEVADARARLQQMRGTGSRAGFRHDTRPAGKLAQQGRRKVVTREQGTVAPRPTKWHDESVGGKTVHQVRFRREGEPGDGDDDTP